MTINEAVKKYQYDINICYYIDTDKEGWVWEVNGGYCQVGSHCTYSTAAEAQDSLIAFLQNFKGFNK